MFSGEEFKSLEAEVDEFHIIDGLKGKMKVMLVEAWSLGVQDMKDIQESREFITAGSGLEESLRKFGETGILKLGSEPVRADVLDKAKEAVCSDRNAEYGEPIDNFGRWAGACNALGYQGPDGRPLKPHDLAVIMGLGKLSRSIQSPDKADTWVDLAGYAAVGYELVTLEG